MSERLANLIMISEEHWKTDQILFLNVNGQREPVDFRVQGMLIIYYVCYFLFYGYLCMTKESVMLKSGKVMEFILLIRDMSI